MRATTLAALLAPDPLDADHEALPSPESFATWCARRRETLDVVLPPSSAEDDDDPRALLAWLLHMAAPSYRALVTPKPDVPMHVRDALAARLASRPGVDLDHAQLPIDADSAIRRAQAMIDAAGAQGRFLLLGDDDGVSLALALLGAKRIVALDIDEALLAFLARQGEAMGVDLRVGCIDVYADAPPKPLLGRFDAAATDPPRSLEAALPFVRYAAATLKPVRTSRLFVADHPDWNADAQPLRDAIEALGFAHMQAQRDLHTYPSEAAWYGDLDLKASQLGVDASWLASLAAHVDGHSHLHHYAPTGPDAR